MSRLSSTSIKLTYQRIVAFLTKSVKSRFAPYALAAIAIAWGITTYWALGSGQFVTDTNAGILLIISNLGLVTALAVLVTRRLVRLWVARQSGTAGSRLHVRFVTLLSLVAIIPTLVVALFSALYFDQQVANSINPAVQSAVDNSVTIAEDYFEEHKRNAALDLGSMAFALRPSAGLFSTFSNFRSSIAYDTLAKEARARLFTEALVLDGNGEVRARYELGAAAGGDSSVTSLPREALREAKRSPGSVFQLVDDENPDRVHAVISLDTTRDLFLYGSRLIDPRVTDKLRQTQEHAAVYALKEAEREKIQLFLNGVFVVIALVMLMAAIWVGIAFASSTIAPITKLVQAAEGVREGDLSIRVDEGASDDEISVLSRTFNRMTSQLQGQRKELVDANEQLDDRRRFTEAVLGGVSVGVVGLNKDGQVDLPNRAALTMLETSTATLSGKPLVDEIPEITELLAAAIEQPDQLVQQQINIVRGGHPKNLLVRISTERIGVQITGFVVTFDDITELVSAQRTAAWADVARRIAHEIKNPLTPIQLSAERLKRKYGKEVTTDPDVFSHCTDTIIRQVGDIRRMVDEFSGFARMPAPTFRPENITELVRQTLLFLEVLSPDIEFSFTAPEAPVTLTCDGRQIAQTLTNVIKNAVESIEGRQALEGADIKRGELSVAVSTDNEKTIVAVEDNGKGLPVSDRHRLTEPYVTTREKGTGLGLAIVKKIMGDHGGELVLEDRPEGGVRAQLIFVHTHLEELAAGERNDEEPTLSVMVGE